LKHRDIDKRRIFSRAIAEWMLAPGFMRGFFNEIKEDRCGMARANIAAPMAHRQTPEHGSALAHVERDPALIFDSTLAFRFRVK
jgi:hypothetical protein